MKKNYEPKGCTGISRSVLKLLVTMKLMLLLICGAGLLSSFGKSYAQNTRLSVELKNSSIETVLNYIETHTEYSFMYDNKKVDVHRDVDIAVKDQTVESILDQLFGNEMKYQMVGRHIIISPKTDSSDLVSTQQSDTISGRVTDSSGAPLPGVTVMLKGTTQGIVTDVEGNYILPNVPGNGTLVFSFVGMKAQEVKVSGKNYISIEMTDETLSVDEVVVVGYGTQKRVNMTGSVASVKGEKLSKVNVANVSNSIGGHISGVVTKQNSGEPGADNAQILLRGTLPLVLVDGIEREWNKISMQDIESLTVLKDASAVAPYGLKGANGVILVTTKRGKIGKVTLTYSSEYGWQNPTNTPDFMSSGDGLRLRNQALIMDNKTAEVIGDDILAQYDIGTDAYPNTDWVKNYLKTSHTNKQTLTVSGGSETARAFVSIGYYDQGNMFGKESGYGRYNVRSNLDLKATKTTEVSVDISIITDKREYSYSNSQNALLDIYRLRATEPDIYSNGLPAFQSSIGWSMNGQIHGGRLNASVNDYQNLGITLKQEIPFIKGLSLKGNFNYDKYNYSYKNWTEPFISYKYNAATGQYDEDNAWLRSKPSLSQGNRNRTFYTAQGYVSYDKKIGSHGIQALAVYERRWGGSNEFHAERSQYDVNIHELNMGSPDKENQANSGTSSESAQDGIVLRANYDYKQKYLLEFAGRYDRSYRYAPDKRAAFFPSVSVGWRVSEENFLKNNFPALDNLKFRASYGKSGNPVGGEFAYMANYLVRNTYVLGVNPVQYQGVYEGKEPNTSLTWETVWKANIGLDMSLWHGLLGLEIDVYRDFRSDKILAPNAIVPSEYGIGLSDENAGKEERYGLDLTLTSNAKISSAFTMQNSLVFGFTRNKLHEIREAPGTYNVPKFRRTGNPSNQMRGYRSAGLFKDQEDIDNWAYQGAVLPGDIKYVDLNGDGKINSEDQVVIAKNTIPEIMYGYNLAMRYKGFDLNLFVQGTGNSDFYLGHAADGSADRGVRYPFENEKPLKDHAKSWTIDNPDVNAPYPRLSTIKRTQNYLLSDYWTRNTAYVRLKTVEFGYNFNPNLTRKVFMQNVRAYVNFYNVWTIYSQMPKDFDSENQAYNSYPQQFITSLGLNITF